VIPYTTMNYVKDISEKIFSCRQMCLRKFNRLFSSRIAVRGCSHNGNISTRELLQNGLGDIVCSDYLPMALVQALFGLSDHGIQSLPDASAPLSGNVARPMVLDPFCGTSEQGKDADLVLATRTPHVPPGRSHVDRARRGRGERFGGHARRAPYAIAMGPPGRVVRRRFPRDVADALERTSWWDWPRETIRKGFSDFEDLGTFLKKCAM
jgi:hypothetical protein